ncbi:MAG: hypothetical protein O7B29_00450 [Deltaproteobacteria bacterium]|nr:hypothetical protein [Deltaproteobacteria bacterium]MCZ6823685.1 hypothetical protein [Deltaproteobacteria bacterium]
MLNKQEEVIRVGVWVVVVAAAVGLIVLLLARSARSQELSQPEDLARWLVSDTPPSAAERLDEAESLLRKDRRRRITSIHLAVVEVAWQVFAQASPGRLLKSGRNMLRQLRDWGRRSAAEERALDLIEAEVRAGSEDPGLLALYTRLREREDRERVKRCLEEGERALARGDLRLARRRLERAHAIHPDSERIQSALEALHAALAAAPATQANPRTEELEAWEASLGAALLLERYDSALDLGAPRPDAELAQAVAQYLSGASGPALEAMQRLSELRGPTGELARRWLRDPTRNPRATAQPMKRLMRSFLEAGSGPVGSRERGKPLRRGAMDSLDLALSIPERLSRGSRAVRSELRNVARRSLRLAPDRPYAGLPRAWEDGHLVLPAARTRYTPITARPVLVSRAAFEVAAGEYASVLAADLGDSEAIWLAPQHAQLGPDMQELPADRARALLGGLATGIERRKLHSRSHGAAVVLERIRRIDRALHEGAGLALKAWSNPKESMGKALKRSLVKGRTATLASVQVKRRKRALNIEKSWRGPAFSCPKRTVCVDRTRSIGASVYGRLDLSADARLGARTSFLNARLGFELSRSGPQGTLVLPLAAWLGLSNWLPVEAYIEIGLGGISGGPRFVRPQDRQHASILPGLNPS